MMKRIFIYIIVALLPLGQVNARKIRVDITDDNWISYTIDTYCGDVENVYVKEKHKKKISGQVDIPETVMYKGKEYRVKGGIDMPDCTNVTSLTIPSGIYWFDIRGCSQLRELKINSWKIEIAGNGFWGCNNLKTIIFVKNVSKIAFSPTFGRFDKDYLGTQSISEIIVEQGNTKYDSRNKCNAVIETATNKLIMGCETTIIPKGIEAIERMAFINCDGLEKIKFPNGLTSIRDSAFFSCDGLKNVVLPSSVKTMGNGVFSDCSNLKEILVPDKINRYSWLGTTTKGTVFKGCPKLEVLSGYSIPYPKWAYEELDDMCPLKWKLKNSYVFYSTNRVYELMSAWQESIAKKGEFESTAQWKKRVDTQLSESRRKAKQQEFTKQAYNEYMKKFTPSTPKYYLGSYNADKGVFEVTSGGKSYCFKVPLNEAERFKANFSNSKITPTYGIVDDKVGIVSVSAVVNGKKYALVDNYIKDESKNMAYTLPPLNLDFGDVASNNNSAVKNGNKKTLDNSIDLNIPSTAIKNNNTFAVIIGNEDYTKVSKVQFAHNDARSFAEYCKKTLGLPEKNVRGYEDATYGTMVSAIKDIQKIAEAYKGEVNVIFYYAGHGIPDNASKNAYLLPVDADGRQMDICYPLSKLYQELGSLSAKSVTVFIDACFSGSMRGDGMLTAARGVAIKTKASAPQGNMVVFSAATDEQTAFPYTEKGHGMFTYYLLKKLRDTKGDVMLGELGTYIINEVKKSAIVVNGREQTPTVIPSQALMDSWQNMKLK